MPKLTVEITTPESAEHVTLYALPIADAASRILRTAPGETQVKVIRRPVSDTLHPEQLPVFASLEIDSAPVSLRTLLSFELADEIAHVVRCPTESVHVLVVPRAAS